MILTWFCLSIVAFLITGYQTAEARREAIQNQTGQPEAISLLGKPLYPPVLSPERKKELEANLARTKAEYDQNPNDPERIIWLGRRTAYLGRYREAIQIYTKGIEQHPDSFKLYRHRGHRYITIREFDKAIADLEKAAALIRGVPDEIEPDGMPNKFNVPTSTSHSNIWYHLGLAYYVKGDFKNALRCYVECMKFSKNDDMLCATSHWLYMTHRRLGRVKEAEKVLAPIHKDMKILENVAYHHLLLMYKGQMSPESLLNPEGGSDLDLATLGYGVGNWYLYNGQVEKAKEIFQRIIDGTQWAAFGYIAAEAELKQLR